MQTNVSIVHFLEKDYTIIVKLQRYQFSFRNIHLVQTYPIIAKANKAKDITDVTHLCHLLF